MNDIDELEEIDTELHNLNERLKELTENKVNDIFLASFDKIISDARLTIRMIVKCLNEKNLTEQIKKVEKPCQQ